MRFACLSLICALYLLPQTVSADESAAQTGLTDAEADFYDGAAQTGHDDGAAQAGPDDEMPQNSTADPVQDPDASDEDQEGEAAGCPQRLCGTVLPGPHGRRIRSGRLVHAACRCGCLSCLPDRRAMQGIIRLTGRTPADLRKTGPDGRFFLFQTGFPAYFRQDRERGRKERGGKAGSQTLSLVVESVQKKK